MVKRKRTRKSTKPKHKRVLEGMFSNIEDAAEKAGVSLSGSAMICVGQGKDKVCAAKQYKSGGVYKRGKNKGLPKPSKVYQISARTKVAMSDKKAAKWEKVKGQTFKPSANQKEVQDIMVKAANECKGTENYLACMKQALSVAHSKRMKMKKASRKNHGK